MYRQALANSLIARIQDSQIELNKVQPSAEQNHSSPVQIVPLPKFDHFESDKSTNQSLPTQLISQIKNSPHSSSISGKSGLETSFAGQRQGQLQIPSQVLPQQRYQQPESLPNLRALVQGYLQQAARSTTFSLSGIEESAEQSDNSVVPSSQQTDEGSLDTSNLAFLSEANLAKFEEAQAPHGRRNKRGSMKRQAKQDKKIDQVLKKHDSQATQSQMIEQTKTTQSQSKASELLSQKFLPSPHQKLSQPQSTKGDVTPQSALSSEALSEPTMLLQKRLGSQLNSLLMSICQQNEFLEFRTRQLKDTSASINQTINRRN